MNLKDVEIKGKDMRIGMGIGGWHMRWTATHVPTKCSVEWETHGHAGTWKLKQHMLACLELMVEAYET